MSKALFMVWTPFTVPLPLLALTDCDEAGMPIVNEKGYIKLYSPYVYNEVVKDAGVSDNKGAAVAQLGVGLVPLVRRADPALNVVHVKAVAYSNPIQDQQLINHYKDLTMRNRAQVAGLIV